MQSNIVYLLAPFVAWLIAQTVKIVLNASLKQKHGFSKYFMSGDMPSAHTATVVALTTVISVHEGPSSLFAVVACFAAITVYDSLVARRSIGEQGAALLRLIETSPFAKDPLPRVALGHKPLEVVVGGLIGVLVGVGMALGIAA